MQTYLQGKFTSLVAKLKTADNMIEKIKIKKELGAILVDLWEDGQIVIQFNDDVNKIAHK